MKTISSSILILVMRMLSCLPLGLLRLLGRLLGWLGWLSGADSRRLITENVSLCFPHMSPAEQQQLVRSRMKHLGMLALEFCYVWNRPVNQVLATIASVEGDDYVRQSLSTGRPVILLAPHIGNWEALGVYLADQFPVTNMYQPPDNPALEDMIVTARKRNGSKLVPTNMAGVKALLKALKQGELVGVLPDQVPPLESGEFAPFFNIPALTVTLCFNLIQRTNATVIVAYAKRSQSGGQFELYFRPAHEDIYSTDQQQSLAALNREVEQCALLMPEQYQWEYKRFKKQPGGERKYYRK